MTRKAVFSLALLLAVSALNAFLNDGASGGVDVAIQYFPSDGSCSDGSGYSFHRFQIFAWTIVLGIIFLSSVYNNLTMPEFSTTLLGLMGISAGTYIGFKLPNRSQPVS